MSMLERVARAIAASQGMRDHYFGDNTMRVYAPLARAAINAMREPTDAMAEFAEDNFDRNGDNIRVCWRAMISTALSEAE